MGELSPRSKDRVISLGEKLACVTIAACLASKVSLSTERLWHLVNTKVKLVLQDILAKAIILDDVVSTAFGTSADDQAAALDRLGSKFYHVIAKEIAVRVRDCEPAIPIVTGKLNYCVIRCGDWLIRDRVLWYNAQLAHSDSR